ncbi:hypothetical protein HMPREF9371_0904 [Neisseria shayeganii 871]|uniref:Uncharacterized protein n=1 Tax=Neisseria shayeganii 871 TaxID=1032488 RepID=G4CH15_9NEIS|nr:hypothetical protein HMPREF9371_0904 [Neisseria shayeganii 871]
MGFLGIGTIQRASGFGRNRPAKHRQKPNSLRPYSSSRKAETFASLPSAAHFCVVRCSLACLSI